MDGLLNLIKQNVVLKSFDGDYDWTEFLRDVISIEEESFGCWLAVTGDPARRAHEYIDRCILKGIYGCCRGQVSKRDMYEIGAVACPMEIPEIYERRNTRSFIVQLGYHWHVPFSSTS